MLTIGLVTATELIVFSLGQKGLFLTSFQMTGWWNRTKGARCPKKSGDPYHKWRRLHNFV